MNEIRDIQKAAGTSGGVITGRSSRLWKPGTFFTVGFIFAAVLIIGALSGILLWYLFGAPSQPNVSIEAKFSDGIRAGEPFTVFLSASNLSEIQLKNARVSLFLPDGVYAVGFDGDSRVVERTIGDIGPGGIKQEQIQLVAASAPDGGATERELPVQLSYGSLEQPKYDFRKKASYSFSFSESAFAVAVSSQSKIFSGEQAHLTVIVKNGSGRPLEGARLIPEFSPSFQFQSSSLPIETVGKGWRLPAIPAGGEYAVKLSGAFIGSSDEKPVFKMTLQGGQNTALAYVLQEIPVARKPLEVRVIANGDPAHVAHAGQDIEYVISYRNNSSEAMENVRIEATVAGPLIRVDQAQHEGLYDPARNNFIWDEVRVPALSRLKPGEEGRLVLLIPLEDRIEQAGGSPSVAFSATASSPTRAPELDGGQNKSVAMLVTKIAGELTVDMYARWRDAATGILNKGPYPPRVGQATQYTVHVAVRSIGGEAQRVKVRIPFLAGVRFTGVARTSEKVQPVYDQNEGAIVWQIDRIPPGGQSEAVFQIEYTPKSQDIGKSVPFLSGATAEGTDRNSGAAIVASDSQAVTSELFDDPTIKPEVSRMVQP